MGENVLGVPALQVEPGPRGKEPETGLRQFQPALAREHAVEPVAQAMQMQHVGGGVGQLRLAQALRAPVAGLLLLLVAPPRPANLSSWFRCWASPTSSASARLTASTRT